jgi:nucleotide-binding universal stress UspA family protein
MEKVTNILAVVEQSESGAVVLDKAVALARRFRAKVQLLIADSLLTPEFASRCAALAYDEVTLSSLFRSGEPLHRMLLRRVHERPPDLLVKAPAGKQSLRKWSLDENDRELASDCPVPVLLAGARPWGDPIRFAAAVDVSDSDAALVARSVLNAAGFLAHGSHGSLDILYSEREERDETVRMERAVKLAQLVREFHVGCERLQMFGGAPEERLPRLVAARRYDVLVLGAVSHREPRVLSGQSLTSKLVEATDGDVVLVKPGNLARGAARMGAKSAFEKLAHHREELV